MSNNPAQQQAAETRALAVALATAAKAGWHLEFAGLSLPSPYDAYLHSNMAQLLVLPTSTPVRQACAAADAGTRLARSDALIVSSIGEDLTFAIGMWTRDRTQWHIPVRPWLSDDGLLWMSAAGGEVSPEFANGDITFPIRAGRLMRGFVPWSSTEARIAGETKAASWLKEVRRAGKAR